MPLSYQETEGTLRWHPDGAQGDTPPWALNCRVVWLGPRVVFLADFARVSDYPARVAFRELLTWLGERGVDGVLARRAERRLLPGSEAAPAPLTGLRTIDVRLLLDRYAEPGSSEWAPL